MLLRVPPMNGSAEQLALGLLRFYAIGSVVASYKLLVHVVQFSALCCLRRIVLRCAICSAVASYQLIAHVVPCVSVNLFRSTICANVCFSPAAGLDQSPS